MAAETVRQSYLMENLPYTIPPGAFFSPPAGSPFYSAVSMNVRPANRPVRPNSPAASTLGNFPIGLPNGDILQSGGPDENLVWHQRLTLGEVLPSQRLGYRLLNLSQLLVRKALVRLGPDVGQVNEFVCGHIPGPIQPTSQQGNVGGIGTGETQ